MSNDSTEEPTPQPDPNEPTRPAGGASKVRWAEYAIAQGMDPDEVEELSRNQLRDLFSDQEPPAAPRTDAGTPSRVPDAMDYGAADRAATMQREWTTDTSTHMQTAIDHNDWSAALWAHELNHAAWVKSLVGKKPPYPMYRGYEGDTDALAAANRWLTRGPDGALTPKWPLNP